MTTNESTALIVGASRGLGLGLTKELLGRGWRVIGTVRDPARGGVLQEFAAASGGRLEIEQADLDDLDQLAALRARLAGRALDVLMVNGGVSVRDEADFPRAFNQVMRTNVLGALTALKLLSELLAEDGAAAVMSSGLGSIEGNTSGGWEPYRASKAALNQSLRSLAAERPDAAYSLTAVAPGWVRTEMGGAEAPLDVETSVRGVADVLISRRGARGAAFINYKGETLPW
jgi:NAD(P)-dependent dehydrogenase (short-subunit alcohol dehydrogenase family)